MPLDGQGIHPILNAAKPPRMNKISIALSSLLALLIAGIVYGAIKYSNLSNEQQLSLIRIENQRSENQVTLNQLEGLRKEHRDSLTLIEDLRKEQHLTLGQLEDLRREQKTSLGQIAALSQENKTLADRLYAIEHPATINCSGEAFIVTRGGSNVLLGRIEIGIFEKAQLVKALRAISTERRALLDEFETVIDKLKKEQDEALRRDEATFEVYMRDKTKKGAWQDAKSNYDRINNLLIGKKAEQSALLDAEWVLRRLPRPDYTCKTDSAGKFLIQLPTGPEYALVAGASRNVGSEIETYAWALGLNASRGEILVTLSNDNMSSDPCILILDKLLNPNP